MTRTETINKAAAWAGDIASDSAHGYDQAVEIGGGYSVTVDGRVFNRKGQEVKSWIEASGYRKVSLFIDGRKVKRWVHRLVAQAFVPNPDNLPQVNHKDENPMNNCADNLEWCTAKYNTNYGSHNARVSASNKGRTISAETRVKISKAHSGKEPKAATKAAIEKNSKAVVQLDNGEVVQRYMSAHEAGRRTGIHFTHISECCRGLRERAGGFRWQFA